MTTQVGRGPSGTTAPHSASLVFDSVSKVYQARRKSAAVPVVTDFSLTVEPGEFVCLLGPSGCGKSTLLNIAAGFLEPSGGEVRLADRVIDGPGPERGVVFQQYALMPWYTVAQNVELGLRCRGVSKPEREQAVAEILRKVGLHQHSAKYPRELSGGMRQRAAIARTLVNDPDVILMDEPFAAVDAQTRLALQNELLALWTERRKTVLFVTHSVQEAVLLADRIIVLSNDAVIKPAVIASELARPRDRLSAEFVGFERLVGDLLDTATRPTDLEEAAR